MRLFVDCTSDEDEKRRIEELCSKEGSEIYIKYVLEEHLSILDILNHFPSCQPNVAMLIGKNKNRFSYFIQFIPFRIFTSINASILFHLQVQNFSFLMFIFY